MEDLGALAVRIYDGLTEKSSVKPDPQLRSLLAKLSVSHDGVLLFDCSRCLFGRSMFDIFLEALVQLITTVASSFSSFVPAHITKLRIRLRLEDANIENGVVLTLANAIDSIQYHAPAVVVDELYLQNNVGISTVGGKRLKRLLKEYPHVARVELDGCAVSGILLRQIEEAASVNRSTLLDTESMNGSLDVVDSTTPRDRDRATQGTHSTAGDSATLLTCEQVTSSRADVIDDDAPATPVEASRAKIHGESVETPPTEPKSTPAPAEKQEREPDSSPPGGKGVAMLIPSPPKENEQSRHKSGVHSTFSTSSTSLHSTDPLAVRAHSGTDDFGSIDQRGSGEFVAELPPMKPTSVVSDVALPAMWRSDSPNPVQSIDPVLNSMTLPPASGDDILHEFYSKARTDTPGERRDDTACVSAKVENPSTQSVQPHTSSTHNSSHTRELESSDSARSLNFLEKLHQRVSGSSYAANTLLPASFASLVIDAQSTKKSEEGMSDLKFYDQLMRHLR